MAWLVPSADGRTIDAGSHEPACALVCGTVATHGGSGLMRFLLAAGFALLGVGCSTESLGLSDPVILGTMDGSDDVSALAVCSKDETRLLRVGLAPDDVVVWEAQLSSGDGVVLNEPLVVADLAENSQYSISGPVPAVEKRDVLRIETSGTGLTVAVGDIFASLPRAEDLICEWNSNG